jgi:hypothetical protein
MKQLIDFCIKMSQNEIIGNDCQTILGIEKRIESPGLDLIFTQNIIDRPYLYTQLINQMRPEVIRALSERTQFPLEALKCPKKGPLFLLYFHLIHTKLALEQPLTDPTPSQTYKQSEIIKMRRIHEVWIGEKTARPDPDLRERLYQLISLLLSYTASNLLLSKMLTHGISKGHPFEKIITTNRSAVITDLIPAPTKTHLNEFILLPNAIFSTIVYIVNSTKNEAYVMQLQAPLVDNLVDHIRSHLKNYYHDELSMLVIGAADYLMPRFRSKLREYTKLKINGIKYEGMDSPSGTCQFDVFIRPNEDSLFIYTTTSKDAHYESKLSELMEGDNRLHSCRLDVEEHTPVFNPVMG